MSTLARIRTKVRRLTGYANAFQLPDADVDNYINDFYLYDLPAHLKIFNLKQTYTFYTEPNIDTYAFTPNVYRTVQPPLYIAGRESKYTQSKAEFFRIYPITNNDENLGTGDGTAGPYALQIGAVPVLRNQVTISTTDVGGNNLVCNDDGSGTFVGDVSSGTINYVTGAITNLVFSANVASGETINVQSVPYVSSRPEAMLFFNDEFILRPVPDKSYKVDIDVYVFPTELVNTTDTPETDDMWQLLAAGAAKKILEDNMNFEDLQKIMPFFNEQMSLVINRTVQQNRPVRTQTIYTQQSEFAYSNLNRF